MQTPTLTPTPTQTGASPSIFQLLSPVLDVSPDENVALSAPTAGELNRTVLHLENRTGREAHYDIWLSSSEIGWMNLMPGLSLLETPNAGNLRAEERRHDREDWLQLRIPNGASCDVLVYLQVPRVPWARAGRYPFSIGVREDPQIGDGQVEEQQFPALALVRPFHQWEATIAPREKRVNLFKRRAEFELCVANSGNDWLYCDIVPDAGQPDLQLECFTKRVAIPPAPDGKNSNERHLPIRAVTRVKSVRGRRQAMPVTALVRRVDAPSLPPRERARGAGAGSPFGSPLPPMGGAPGAALGGTTNETITASGAELAYYPPIPATIGDAFRWVFDNIRQISMVVIGLLVMIPALSFVWQQRLYMGMKVEALTLDIPKSREVTVKGMFLQGAHFSIHNDKKVELGDAIDVKIGGSSDPGGVLGLVYKTRNALGLNQGNVRVTLRVPSEFKNTKIRIGARRVAILPFISDWMKPRFTESINPYEKPNKPVAAPTPKAPLQPIPVKGSKDPGDEVFVEFPKGDLPPQKGRVKVNDAEVLARRIIEWKPKGVKFLFPENEKDETVEITLILPDGTQIAGGTVKNGLLAPTPAPEFGTPDGDAGGAGAAGSGGGGDPNQMPLDAQNGGGGGNSGADQGGSGGGNANQGGLNGGGNAGGSTLPDPAPPVAQAQIPAAIAKKVNSGEALTPDEVQSACQAAKCEDDPTLYKGSFDLRGDTLMIGTAPPP